MFIKIYQSKVQNAKRTLDRSIDVEDLISKLGNKHLISELAKFRREGEVNLWDVGKRDIAVINIGDMLAISCKDVIYFGQIIGIIGDAEGEIGDKVGWARQYEKPWVNVIILKNMQFKILNEDIFNFIQDHSKHPYIISKSLLELAGKEMMEFSKLLDSNISPKNIVVKEKPIVNKQPLELPDWLDKMIARINKLKLINDHKERGHESLIEDFLVNLGYEKDDEIKFQVGRIDILLAAENKPLAVIEVKKYWNLNANKDIGVVEQAFRYSLKIGTKFIIISNGDYYGIYDTDKGRTYADKFLGDFTLTNLNENGLKLIEFLKRNNLKNHY